MIKGQHRDETQSMFKIHMSTIAKSVMEAHEKRNIDTKVVGNADRTCLIHPTSDFHNMWDLVMAVLILLTVVTVPLGLGWEVIERGNMGRINMIIDLTFCVDFLLNHITGYVDKSSTVVVDPWLIVRNYWSTWAVPDIVSSFPYDIALGAYRRQMRTDNAVPTTRVTRVVKTVKLLRIAKVLRLMKLSSVYHYLQQGLRYLENNYEIRFR